MQQTSAIMTEPEGAAAMLDIESLPTLASFGFDGGHAGLVRFTKNVFASQEPRFLRSDEGELVVFRNSDLQAIAALPEVANMPPAVIFGPDVGTMIANESVPGSGLARVLSNQAFTANPPLHKPLRKILVNQLGAKQVALMEPLAVQVVGSILDRFESGDVIDFVAQVAEQITLLFWGELLGMSETEIAEMEGHVRGLTNMFFLNMSAADFAHLDQSSHGYLKVVHRAAMRTLAAGTSPFINQMAEELAQIDLPDDLAETGLVPKDIGDYLAGNLVDGYHTAAVGAANAIHVLATDPGLMAKLRAEPAQIPLAIFEALRLEPPVIYLKRWVQADILFDGIAIPRGTRVIMLWGAGGFDPTAFPKPYEMDLTRPRRGSTVFGGGIHICPGRFMSGMLSRVLIEAITNRNMKFESIAATSFYEGHLMSQLRELPLRLIARN